MNYEKGTPAYRRGYRDCRDHRPRAHYEENTFTANDYNEGWQNAWNEDYWDSVKEDQLRRKSLVTNKTIG